MANRQKELPQFPKSYIDNAKKYLMKIMDKEEKKEFDDLSEEEQSYFVRGFLGSCKEYMNAVDTIRHGGNDGDNGGGGGGGELPEFDNLPHWAVPKNGKGGSGEDKDKNKKKLVDEAANLEDAKNKADQNSKETEDAANQASSAANNADGSKGSQSMDDIRNAAQDAADAAADSAAAAKQVASKLSEAYEKANRESSQAGLSGTNAEDLAKLERNKIQAGNAASKANAASNKADAAMNDVEKAYDKYENAKAQGNASKMSEAMNEAVEAAKKVAAAAKAAADAAKDAAHNADNGQENLSEIQKEIDNWRMNSSQVKDGGKTVGEGESVFDEPVGHRPAPMKKPIKQTTHKTPMDANVTFGGNDVISHEEGIRIAERAGQPYEGDDFNKPENTALNKLTKTRKKIESTWQDHNTPGTGNSPIELIDILGKLFPEPKIDWRDKVEDFMTDRVPGNTDWIIQRNRFGVEKDSLLYKDRFRKVKEVREEKNDGIAQVFFLVDASGSMGFATGDGRDVFEHIMSELIELETKCMIKRSAYAPFNAGGINRDDVIEWANDSADCPDEDDIKGYLPLPAAGGGTSALQAIECINKYPDVYNTTDDPLTLLIVVSDGVDNYSNVHNVMSDLQIFNTIFIVTQNSEAGLEAKRQELLKYGFEDDHIILVNTDYEWGSSSEK